MADEIAGVGIRVDTDGVSKGITALDALASQGPKVEKSLQGVETSAAKTGKSLATLGQGGADSGLAKVSQSSKEAADNVGKLGESATKSVAAVKQVDKASSDTAKAISGVGAAVKSLVTSNEAIVTSIRGMTSAQNAYTDKLAEEARQLRATVAERDKYIAQTAGMLAASKEIASGLGSRIDSLKQVQAASAQTSESMLGLVRTGVSAFLGGAVVQGAKAAAAAIYEASAAGERLRTMLNFATGGKSAEEIEYLRQVTGRLGLEFASTARAYGQFQAAAKGTSIEGAKARDVFESIAKASAVMGLSTDQTSGVLLALQQMISKGTVQAEELRGQLGERLPGAFQIAAKAMGVTTAELGKMLEQGLVVADDFLPKFARALNENIGGAADSAADRLDAATNRFANSWERLKQIIGDAGVSSFIKTEVQAVTDDITVFGETMEKVKQKGGGFFSQILGASAVETGRLAFSVLNGGANAFNGTLNSLTNNFLGFLKLPTNLAVLPDVFKTSSQQAAALALELAAAEKRFTELKAQGGTEGGNVYWKSEMFQLAQYIKELKAAKAERDKLSAPAAYSAAKDSAAADVSEAARIDAIKAAMLKVQQGLSGVKDSFYKDLNALYAGYKEGLITLSDYQKQVAKLIDESGGGKANASAIKASNKELDEQRKLVSELAGLSGDFYEDWARLNTLFKAGKLDLDQLVQAQAKLLEKQPGIAANSKAEIDAAKAIAEARAAARRAEDKAISDFIEKQREQEAAALKSIRDRTTQLEVENEASVIAQKENISLAEAINKVSIARLQDKAAGLQDGSEAKNAILQQIEAYKLLGQQISTKELNTFLDPSKAKTFGEALTGAFEAAGNGLAKLSTALQTYAENQRQIAANTQRLQQQPAGADRDLKTALLREKSQENQLALYASMTGAAKNFFSEGTRGYKALEAAETAFRLVQLASDLQKGLSAAAVGIAAQAKVGGPYAWVAMAAMAATMASLGFNVGFGGGAPQGGGDGGQQATGTGTVLGDAAAKSESIAKSIDRLADTAKLQLTTQSGMLSALRNIENSISGVAGLIARTNSGDLTSGNSFGVQTGSKSPSGLSLAGSMTGGLLNLDNILFGGKITQALFGSKTSITGTGLNLPQQTLAQAMVNSQLQQYVDTYSSKKFLGITYSTSTGSQYQAADAQLAQQFTTIFKSFYEGVSAAAGPLGQSLDEVEARLNGFVLNIGKIDLKDLTGEQIQEKLSAILGAAADNIANAAIPGLNAFQKVGEGYFETLIRVASGVESATASLESLGIAAIGFGDIARKQGDVAAEIVRQSIVKAESTVGQIISVFGKDVTIPKVSSVGNLISNLDGSADDLVSAYKSLVDVRDILISVGQSGDALTASLIRGAGSLDDLQNSLSSYFENFFSDAERTAAGKAQLQTQFDRLGLGALPQTREAFRNLVEDKAIVDTTTEAGQKLYAQLIALSGAFADLVPAVAEVADTTAETMRRLAQSYADSRTQLEVELLRANGDEAGARAKERAAQLARDTAGLSAEDAAAVAALYDYNVQLRDQITATKAAAEAQKAIEAAMASAANEAARAAEQFRQAWQSITDTLFDEVARIRGLLGGSGTESLAQVQARFAVTTAQARSGDQEAAKLLPGLSQTLLQLAEANATSLLDLQRIRALVAASLEQTGTQLAGKYGLTLPKFYVGTNYVPKTMAAIVHEGEAIVPRAYNPAAAGGAGTKALTEVVQGLREDNRAQALAIVKFQIELNKVIKKWDSEGIPEERRTAA